MTISYHAVFTGPGDRARLLALGDVDQRERDAVRAAEERRANTDATRVGHITEGFGHPCIPCAAVGRLTWLSDDGTCRRTDVHRVTVSA